MGEVVVMYVVEIKGPALPYLCVPTLDLIYLICELELDNLVAS